MAGLGFVCWGRCVEKGQILDLSSRWSPLEPVWGCGVGEVHVTQSVGVYGVLGGLGGGMGRHITCSAVSSAPSTTACHWALLYPLGQPCWLSLNPAGLTPVQVIPGLPFCFWGLCFLHTLLLTSGIIVNRVWDQDLGSTSVFSQMHKTHSDIPLCLHLLQSHTQRRGESSPGWALPRVSREGSWCWDPAGARCWLPLLPLSSAHFLGSLVPIIRSGDLTRKLEKSPSSCTAVIIWGAADFKHLKALRDARLR